VYFSLSKSMQINDLDAVQGAFFTKVGYQGVMATALVTVAPPPFSPL
jgi:hypothetical protein